MSDVYSMYDEGEEVEIAEPALLIRINKLYEPGMDASDLYDTTRGVWVLGPRRENAKYAFAVYQGEILEVYAIDEWHPAGTTPYSNRKIDLGEYGNRWEFTGGPAADIRNDYVGKSVAAYFRQGAANPVMYVNC